MNVNIYELKELHDIHKFFRGFRAHGSAGWWFRGHADIDWKLVPKAGRTEFYLGPDRNSGKGRDLGRFNHWARVGGSLR